ncbi:MAG: transcriptional regulator [Methylotenera sp.]|nr:MAG: transcriptional regulator [Methylotenera sp.]PPD52214.1 MAG: transcriptional regulator [Methylotenera sp.]
MAKKSPSFSGNPALVCLGAAIRATRKAKGLSQEALAELADIDRSYMGGIERGEHNLAIMNLLKIADALGMKASSLLDETGG